MCSGHARSTDFGESKQIKATSHNILCGKPVLSSCLLQAGTSKCFNVYV